MCSLAPEAINQLTKLCDSTRVRHFSIGGIWSAQGIRQLSAGVRRQEIGGTILNSRHP
jgi:hypothetical protein